MQSKVKCRLVLDSCCDLPAQVFSDAGVEYFKFPFSMNDGEHLDDMWQSMEGKEFYGRLRRGEISGTAQIPIMELAERLEEWADEGTPTVYLAFSSGLSGTFETVERLAADTRAAHPDFEFFAVDTKLASIAEGLLAYEAIRQRDRGLSAAQLAAWAEEARWFVNCGFTIDELEHLRRGGRIPDMAATAGSKLNIKPMLDFNADGTLSLAGVARGRKKALKALVAVYDEKHRDGNGSDETVLVAHADCEGDMRWVEDHLDRPEGSVPPIHCEIGPVIGSHVGPGMVAIAFWGDDRRETISIADRIANRLGRGKDAAPAAGAGDAAAAGGGTTGASGGAAADAAGDGGARA